MIYFLFKIASPCCGDCAPLCDVGQSHSPINLKSLEAGGWGDMMVLVFFYEVCALVLFVVLCTK